MQNIAESQVTQVSDRHKVATHCPYCALQCGMHITGPREQATITGNPYFPVNNGRMCIKGWHAAATIQHPERLLTPLQRTTEGTFESISWKKAIAIIAENFQRVQARYGKDALGVLGGGSLTNEKAYLLGKFARVALGTSQIDYNGRFCMSSAATAGLAAFGLDRGLPFPIADIAQAEVVMLIGSNAAETMPPLMQYFESQRQRGGQLIVVDPRASLTTHAAAVHMRLTPGTDAALANGILHILIREGLLDYQYIQQRTSDFERVKANVALYWPERVERITGIPEAQLLQVARMLGEARSAIILTARGAEQQQQGVHNVLSYINIALALGLVGRPGSGYGCLTGQGNGQGGREHGQKADQLPGYRHITDPLARQHIAGVWGIAEEALPGPGRSAYEMLEALGQPGGVHGLMIMGTNLVVSAPNALHIQERLRAVEFMVVADFFLSETAQMANIVLPTTQWAEEDGTMTNAEGRVLRRQRAFTAPQGIYSDGEILCMLAVALDKGAYFPYSEPRQIFEELARASAGGLADYAGISYEKIEEQNGVFWPCPSAEHPGTPRLFQESFPTSSGRAQFHAVIHQAPAEEPDTTYPLYLTTGRVLAQYQSGTQTRRIEQLNAVASQPWLEVHPTTARTYGIADGELVQATTRRGSAVFRAKLTSAIREDTIFVPFHWSGQQSANRLTNPALDPNSHMPEFKVCAVRIERTSASSVMEV